MAETKNINGNNDVNKTISKNKKFSGNNGDKYKGRQNFYRKRNNGGNKKAIEKTVEEYEKEYIKKRMKDGAEKPACPICGESIYITEEAIHHKQTGSPAHFDCILKCLKEENNLEIEKEEKIVYLGSGTFGVIQERQAPKNGQYRLFVRKRINYEDRKIKKVEDDIDPEEEEFFNV